MVVQQNLPEVNSDLQPALASKAERREALSVLLRSPSGVERRASVMGLGQLDSDGVELVCGALRDADPEVRLAAAETLGRMGDTRAVEPLTQALRHQLLGGSANAQRIVGLLVVIGAVLLAIGLIAGIAAIKAAGASFWILNLASRPVSRYFQQRRQNSPMVRAICTALTRIAEQNPAPVLRMILPELEGISGDMLHQEPGTRAASREAARRIEELTAHIKNLPVPAESPIPSVETLPLPAAQPVPAARSDTL
ncbi:MAG: HEAT repeat domain-containing protein [Armatimonadetes bacterium]|nr:HEAT repeat domain-containing protein [Armatimonadota bacterium]